MLNVASIWRVSVLMIPLAVMAGCDWIPVRRRVDPALYPIPNRPDPDLIRGRRPVLTPASVKASGPGKVADPAATDDRRLPPLPELVRVSPGEILEQSAPTPLLDAALERAEAIHPARIDDPDGLLALNLPMVGPTLPIDIELEPVPVPEADPITAESSTQRPSDSIDLPPIPEATDSPSEMTRDANAPRSSSPESDAAFETAKGDPEPAEGEAATDDDPAIPEDEDLVGETLPEDSDDRELAPEVDTQAGTEPLPLDVGPWTLDGPTDEATRWQVMMELLAGAGGETSDPGEAPGPTFRISRTEFCREILGFDRIDPISPRTLEAGERTLIYCEVEGVDYLPEHDVFTSRLETILEIVPNSPTEVAKVVLWREFVTFEDRCSRPRHDYFVGYLLTVPSTVSPGPHLLRVTQRDPRLGIETVADLPFEVVAPSIKPAPRFQ